MAERPWNTECKVLLMTLIDCGIVRLDHPLLHDVVSERSLRRWRRVWSANGGSFSSQRAQIRPGPQPLLPPEAIDYLRRRLEQKGTMTLAGLARCLEDTPWPVVSTSSIHRMIKGIAFTRKRSFKHAAQQCPIKRRDFLMRTAFYTPEQLVFIDESGFDAKVYESNYSYSAKGTRAITPVRFNRGVRWSILPAISLSRPLFAERIFDGTLNGELFEDWIANVLLPQCEPYPGKRSVIILDNCRVHHREGIREMVEAAGCRLEFLPPYSPDFNPIEKLFSKMKAVLRSQVPRGRQNMVTAIHHAAKQVRRSDIEGWYRYSGYM